MADLTEHELYLLRHIYASRSYYETIIPLMKEFIRKEGRYSNENFPNGKKRKTTDHERRLAYFVSLAKSRYRQHDLTASEISICELLPNWTW